MQFLLDANLPRRLAVALRSADHECWLTRDVLTPDASDLAIAALANNRRAVLWSKDADFLDLVARRVLTTPLVRVQLRNMTAAATSSLIMAKLPGIVAALQAGQQIVYVHD